MIVVDIVYGLWMFRKLQRVALDASSHGLCLVA